MSIQCNVCDKRVRGWDGLWIWGSLKDVVEDPWEPTLFLCASCFLSNRDSLCQCVACREEAREFEAGGYYRGPELTT
jgi:hypothetical protein